MKNYVQPGNVLLFTAVAAVTSGDLVIVEDMVCVALQDADEGDVFSGYVEGVFDLEKASGAIDQGAKVYWDASESEVTTTAESNTLIGHAAEAAASGDATAKVRLMQS
jgi:predicted RecA/RadA family phage recombinase